MRCFVESIDEPELRPDPMEWVHGLEEAENALNRCNAGHEYSGHLHFCPLCAPPQRGPLALLSDIPYQTRKFVNKLLIPMAKVKSQAKKRPLRKQTPEFWDPVGVVVLVGIIFAVGITMIVIPMWQQSVRNEAIRIVSTLPFGYGQHKTLPTDPAQNVGTVEAKANMDSDQEQEAEKTPDKSSDNAGNAVKEDSTKAKPVAKMEEKPPKAKDLKENKSGQEALPRSQPELQKDLKSQLDETNIKPVARRSVRWGNRISVGNMEHLSVLHTLLKDSRVSVTTMAFSPSGNLLVTGLSDNTIKVWRVKDGAHILTLRGHTGALSCVAFSPDGALIASGSSDRTIRLWKAGNGELVSVLNGHQGMVTSLDFSMDGSLLASGSADNNIRIWKVKSGLCINTLIGHKMDVNAVAFSPSGRLIASGSKDNTVKLWRTDDGTLVSSITAHHWDITSIAFSPGGNVLASASMDDSIRFWRIKDSMQVQKLMGHFKGVTSIGFSPDGELLTSGSDDGTVRLWRVNDGSMLRTIGESTHPVKCVAYSPNGSTIAAGLDNGLIYIWGLPQ
jgi:WD40 repeat protein